MCPGPAQASTLLVVGVGTPQSCPRQPPRRSGASAPILKAVEWPLWPHPCGPGQLGSPTKSQEADSSSFPVSIVVCTYLCLLPDGHILGTCWGGERRNTGSMAVGGAAAATTPGQRHARGGPPAVTQLESPALPGSEQVRKSRAH